MELSEEVLHRTVREEFTVLLKLRGELKLPAGLEQIGEFYRRTANACLEWAEKVEGGRMTKEFSGLESISEKASYGHAVYLFSCFPVWEAKGCAAWVCQTRLTDRKKVLTERRLSQVWNLEEQTMLTRKMILELYPTSPEKRLPFRPDGIYPTENCYVCYRNGRNSKDVQEFYLPYHFEKA